jgi:hypothetical protein
MAAVLLVAAGTRISGAAHRPIWTDEGWTIWVASDHHLEVVVQRLINAPQPPLYYTFLSGWWIVAGDSRIALRFLSIGAGLLSVALVYRIGADVFGHRAALYGSWLFAALPITVYYAQEIRYYSWLVLSVSLMSLFFIRYLRHPCRRWSILYTISVIVVLYTMYLGATVLAVQAVIGLLVWQGAWRDKTRLIRAWLVAIGFCAPWFGTLLKEIFDWLQSSGFRGTPFNYETTSEGLSALVKLLLGGQTALLGALYMLGACEIIRRRERKAAWLAQGYILLAGVGIFLGMALINVQSGILAARTVVYLTPMLMLVCGYGLTAFPPAARIVLASVSVMALLLSRAVIQPRLDYPRIAQAVAANYTPGDPVVLETGWDDNAFMYELSLAMADQNPNIIRTLPWVKPTPVEPEQKAVVAHIGPLLRSYQRVWVVQWLQSPQVIPFLDHETSFTRALTLEIPTGEQYADQFPHNPVVQVVLFARPDINSQSIVYGDALALVDSSVPAALPAGEPLQIDLWWSALAPPPLAYAVGVGLLKPGQQLPIVQYSSSLARSGQGPGDVLIFDRHTLCLPRSLAPGPYQVIVQVYPPGCAQPLPVQGAAYAVVGQVEIE